MLAAMRCVRSLALVLAPAVAAAQEPTSWRLRDITVSTSDVFTIEEERRNPLFALANLLHVTTRAPVLEREVWVRPGEPITTDEVAEIERNLRALGLFGAVAAQLQPVGDGEADLLLRARDRFTLGASANVGNLGGVQKLEFGVSERNLFGTGKSISFGLSETEGEEGIDVRWFDPQFLGSRHVLGAAYGDTEDGGFIEFVLARPFRRIEDPLTYGMEVATLQADVDYYRLGDEVGAVPIDRRSVRLYGAAGDGPRELRQAFGMDFRARRVQYGAAKGPAASSLRVPADHDEVELGPYWSLDWRPRFLKLRRIDSIDFDEDIGLGAHFTARAAARYRDEVGQPGRYDPVFALESRLAAQPTSDTLLSFSIEAAVAAYDGSLQSHRLGTALHAYWLGLPKQTLCGSITYDTVGEERDLIPQLTLGEDNGLRGYPAREFTGDSRVRINLENRIDTGIELWSIRLGAVAFFDAGFLHDPQLGLSMSDPLRSVGFGLRLGSSHLLGSRVVRIDVAWPLDDPFNEGYNPSLSFTFGQVFTVFGNASALETQF